MSRRSERIARRRRPRLYALIASGAVVAGVLILGLSLLGLPALNQNQNVAGSDPVENTAEPNPGEPNTEETNRAERTQQEDTREATTEQTAEPAAEETIRAKPVEPAQEEPVQEEPVEEQPEQAASGGVDLSSIQAPASSELYLSVPKMGLVDDYVVNSVDEATLTNGAGHVPETGFPWQPGANTYIASHVLGYEGTGSYMHFAALPTVTYGDEVYLSDANGNQYRYEVYEIIEVSIYETWVMEPVGADVVSLQTCINPPAYDVRLVVRGKLVETIPA